MSLGQELELIRQFSIFSKIPLAMQKLLCFSSERLTFEPGQLIFQAGDVADGCYIVIEGTAEVSVLTAQGPQVVSTAGRNEMIGEIEIFGDVPRTATVAAKTRLDTLKISKKLFFNVILENPDAAIELIRILACRLADHSAPLQRVAQ